MSDEPDSEEHYYSGSEQDDQSHESESDSGGPNHGLLDLEASEASSEPDNDAGRLSDDGSYDGSYAEYNFPKFMQLPPEIREMVWGAFCPDLGPGPRVFELHLHTIISPPGAVHLPSLVRAIVAGPHLETQTEPMRAVLAVHQESRALGLKSAPHELSLSDEGLVRYHEERDVLFVSWNEEILLRGIALRFQELGIEAQNIAFPSIVCRNNADELVDLMYLLPQARRLFILDEEDDLQDSDGDDPMHVRDYAWTVADQVHRYRLDAEEEGMFGLIDPVSRIFCWPDLDNFPGFAKEKVTKPDDNWWWSTRIMECRLRLWNPLEDSRELNQDDISDEEKAEAIERLQNIEVWPMYRFNFGEGLDRFDYLQSRARGGDRLALDDLSESQSSGEEVEDEYDSSGIDDDPIDDSTSDEDEDEMIAQHIGQTLGPRLGPYNSHLYGFDDSSLTGGLSPANFSSGEEVHEHGFITISSDSDDSGSQSRASRRKRRVVDSDSDESATETEQTPPSSRRSRVAHLLDVEDLDAENDDGSSGGEPARQVGRRGRAQLIDSEDEDEEGNNEGDEDDMPQASRPGRRRGRAVPADSEDEEEEVAVQQPSGSRRRRGRVVQVDSDEEDEDDGSDSQGGGAKTKDAGSSDDDESSSADDEADEPPPPRRVSLAKRLSMESRQARSRHSHRFDDSEGEEMTGDGYGYSDDQEDEADGSDNGMVMGMAGEYGGEDGESEEEY